VERRLPPRRVLPTALHEKGMHPRRVIPTALGNKVQSQLCSYRVLHKGGLCEGKHDLGLPPPSPQSDARDPLVISWACLIGGAQPEAARRNPTDHLSAVHKCD